MERGAQRPEGHAVIQKDLNRLERGVDKSIMKLKKGTQSPALGEEQR